MPAKDGLTVLFYPAFDNSEEFTDHYYRMLWYLNPLRERIRRIIMPYEGEAPSVGALPYYLDAAIKRMADESGVADVVEVASSEHTGPLENAARESDIVLVWRAGRGKADRVPAGPLKSLVMKKKHYLVDHRTVRHAGSFYLRVSAEICNTDATVMECSEKFRQIPAHSFSKTGYIYGTGPSLQAALAMDLSDGTSIVCNTMVKNKELMRKLKPAIIAVADPIFHAGCSSYAGEFRRHLGEAMAEFKSYLVVPMRDYPLYMANMDASLRERIIGVPFVPANIVPDLVPNLNLYKNFYVSPAASILMLFLIPLAATFFEKTFILGCDGRPLDQDDYFWKHDPASQLTGRMDDIQVAHPAFFQINYNDFYLEHCRVVGRWLDEGERRGRTFLSLTPSHIPALKCRQASPSAISAKSSERPVEGRVHIISLNPQLTDSLGHPLAYDSQLNSGCAERGVEFISAANTRIEPDLLEAHPYLRAVFTDRPSKSGLVTGHIEPPASAVEAFRREAEAFVDGYLRTCNPADNVILYLYTGGLPHIEVLCDIIKGRPQVSAHINLFWLGLTPINHQTLGQRWAGPLRKGLIEPRLHLTVLTHEMQEEIQRAVGIVLPVAPAPSTTFDDTEARNVLKQSEWPVRDDVERADITVVFPGLMRKPKGYDLSISVIRMLSKRQTRKAYKCTLRHVPRRGTLSELIDLVQGVRGLAHIVEGILPREEFQRMLKEADIIVLPYQPSEFSNRTSSILIEALLCGVPVVVQRGTWLGNLVARHDCGVLAKEASPKAYVKAIEAVAANHHQYRKNAIVAGRSWLEHNSWATLLDFILNPPPPLAISHLSGPQERTRRALGRAAWRVAARIRTLRHRPLHRRIAEYLMTNYPTIITIGGFGKWSLEKLKKTLPGAGGIALLLIVGLYVAGALIEPLRWYLVGTATALLVLGGGLLALSYARFILNRLMSDRRRADELVNRVLWRPHKGRYRGQRAFIIGNGPSLNRTPLHLLKNEVTLCFNRFDLMFERLSWRPPLYMCVDDRVAEDTAYRINEIIPLVKFAFLPDIHPGGVDFRRFIEDAHNVLWLSLRGEGFYDDLPTCGMGGTVVHAGLQVLSFMGFSPIYLVGVDMEFKDHRTVVKHDQRNWTSTHDDDPNHFDPRYFGAGAKFHYPRLHESMLPSLEHAREHLDAKGVQVVNAGIGGSLEIFPRVDFRSLFDVGKEIELEMLLSALPPELQPDAHDALRGERVIEVRNDWDERSPFQVTTLPLAEQLIPKVIFTHIPYGPFGDRYLFIRRDKVSSAAATTAAG